jgi:hypothetical protein
MRVRFNTNISNVMTASWHSEGRSTSTDCGGIPDIVTIPANCSEAIIVGELKIPWMHDLQMNIVKPAIEQSIWVRFELFALLIS